MDATKLKYQQLIIGLLSLLFYTVPSSFAYENILQQLEKDFQRVVTQARPIVVKVVATQVSPGLFPSKTEKLAFTRQSIGSGIVIDAAGHVVTTTFEMENPSKIEVIFKNKMVALAKLIGVDTLTDIAVLRIENTNPETAPATDNVKRMAPNKSGDSTPPHMWGDSSKIDTGSWVVTIGNSYGNSPIISFGIVGGWDTLPNQMCGDLIKINAAVTPGNSGGAVVNTSGEVVGMILAVLTDPMNINSPVDALFEDLDNINLRQMLVQPPLLGERNQKIAFAMPIEMVNAVAKEIIEHGKVARGWLGVEVDVGESGVFVTGVIEDSPAHKCGLLPKDLILEFNEVPVQSYAQLLRCVVSKRPHTEVRLKVGRNGAEQHCTVILGEKR